jgi:hypothetical protein
MSPLVIIVAGPSGSGKSTFIELLQLGKIDGTIRRHLPASCECWPIIGATRPTPEATATVKRWVASGRQPGLILHYDNSFIFRTSEKSHEKTADRELFLAGGSPMIVSIRPTAGQLKKQFEHRLNRQQAGKNWLRNAWRSVRTLSNCYCRKCVVNQASGSAGCTIAAIGSGIAISAGRHLSRT